MCSGGAQTLAGFLRTTELDAADADAHADAFEELRAGKLQAIIVHGVYPPEVLAAVVTRLERREPDFLQTWFPEKFRSWFFGRNLNLSDARLTGYFDEAARFHAQLEALFPPGLGIARHVGELLARIDRGRPFVPAPGPLPGTQYMFTTLRAHAESGYLPAHFDNEQRLRASYQHLSTLVELNMMSFVLVLAQPEAGGALEVFDLCVEPQDARLLNDDSASERPDVSVLDSVSFRLPPGTLIVLDSGRYLHRLTPVQGARKRWTACSFMARARARAATYCWG
jgi:carrier-protein-independent halogenase WelO5-like protein